LTTPGPPHQQTKEGTIYGNQDGSHRRWPYRADPRVNAARNPGVTLAGIADAIPEAAQKLASDLAAPVVTVESIFADPAIDAVLIGSSTDTHADLIQRSAKAGKHIFCEKPVDLTSSARASVKKSSKRPEKPA